MPNDSNLFFELDDVENRRNPYKDRIRPVGGRQRCESARQIPSTPDYLKITNITPTHQKEQLTGHDYHFSNGALLNQGNKFS